MTAVLTRLSRVRPWSIPRGRWYFELAGAVAFYELYDFIQARTAGDESSALRAGRAIFSAERSLHLDVERSFNSFATAHAWAGIVSGYWYAVAHVLVTGCVLAFLWLRRPRAYAQLRTGLVALSLPGLLIYWLDPTAPPRFTVSGLTDTLAAHNILGAAHLHKGLVDLYAAMPSLHMAWSTWCAAAIVMTTPRTRPARHLAWLYPVFMAADVLTTANHFFLDIVAGVALTAVVLPWYRPQVERAPATVGRTQQARVAEGACAS